MKTKITLKSSVIKASLLMAFLFIFVLHGASQSTENFEGETFDATSFSHDGTTYTLSGTLFDVESWSGSHSPSTCIDNYDPSNVTVGLNETVSITNSTNDFKVSSLWIYIGSSGGSSGGLNIQGKLDNSEQFNQSVTFEWFNWVQVDLSSHSNTYIDELNFIASGDIRYIAIDDIVLNISASITNPSTPAYNVMFSDIATTQANISWTNGSGSNRAVFIKQASSGSASPVDGGEYTANTVFGVGSQIGTSGWYCIYNGTGSSTSVSGLVSNQTYRVHVCEYNIDSGIELYSTASGNNNPANVVMDMGYAQTLETFEGEINPTFSENGYNFTVTGNLYVDNYPSDAYNGDYLVDNFTNSGSGPGVLGSFTNSISDFYVHSIAVNPNETTAATPSGTISMIGKLNGSTLYTQTLTVNQTNDFPDNYYIVEFSAYNNILIDEIEFVTSGDIDFLKIDNFEFSAPPLNSAPTINIANTTLAYTENDVATQIDAAATVSDVDGDAEWDGGKLDVQITASAEVADEISISDTDGDGTAITISGSNIFSNAVDIGDLSVSGGVVTNGTKLTITFDADATNAIVQEVLQSIRYRNTSNDPVITNRTILISATDKHAATASDTRTISVTAINDEPTLTATGATVNFYEEGTSADLFSAISISTIESAQNIDNLILTVSNVSDLTYERLQIDGENVVLTDGNAGTTVNSSFNFSVSLSGSTATVIIDKDDTPANYQTMIDGLGYDNTSHSVTAANRVVTITSISDNGSDVGANDATNNTLAVIATVMVSDNTAPSLATSTPSDDATNATLSGDIVLSFNDNMAKGTGNITIRNSSDNSSFEVIDVTSAQVSITGMDVTIDPSLTLLKGTAYYIEIDATALDDEAGNSFAGISGNTTLNFTTVDVVINEVVTEPQTDWSTTGFNGSNGGGAITNGTDEWVELFINSDGIDLSTGWTIEVSSQGFSGSLNADGAFQTINYVGTGTINNTDIGDFLVLGNPIGSFYMNLTTTITLKDPGGAIVDEVSFGASPLPSCDSDDEDNESAQRFPNGTDTDSNSDWTQGKATPGAANSGPSVTLSVSETAIAEAAGTSTITATLSAICSENVTVSIGANASSTAEASDYTLAASILITAGNLTGTTVLTALQDSKDENNETVVIDITGVSNGTEAGDQQQTVSITDDDDAPTVYFNSTASSGLESVSSADVQVDISAESGLDVTVNFTVAGTATGSGTDYTLTNGTLTITAGSTSENITIASIVEDIIDEYDETVVITLSSPVNATLGTNTVHTYTILDNDNPPLVTLDASTPLNIAEASGISTITASLSTVSGKNVTVNLAFTGTAIDGDVDYNYSSSSITIPAGSLFDTSTITAVQDVLDEDNETIIVDIDNVTDGTEDGEQQVTVTITDDDDMPTVTFSTALQSSADESGTMTITAQLSALSGRDVTVPFTVNGASTATGGGTDYSITASPITIAAGNPSQIITITIATDALDEYNETVIVDMGTPTNATQGTTTTHTAIITDDDLSPLVSLTAVPVSIAEASGVSTVTATIDAVSAKMVTVYLAYTGTATGGGTDYTASGSSIVINPGSTTGVVSVTAVQDLLSEGNETVIVDVTTVDNGTEDDVQQQTITIVDDDLPLVALSQSNTSFDEAAGINTITATLANTFPLDVTVTIGVNVLSSATGGGTDYSLSSTTITIFAGQLIGTATLTAVQDDLDEDNETVIIDIESVVNGVEDGIQQVTSTITDDDTTPTITFTSASQSSVAETGTMTITAQLSAISGRDVTVPFTVDALSTATGGGTDYSIAASPITITKGSISEDIIITIATDALDENNETIIVDMGVPLNATATGTTSHSATITDDDATPTVAFNSVSSNGMESVSSADLQVDLSAISGLDVTVNYIVSGTATGNGTDFTLANGSLTISAGDANDNITIASIVNDLLDENNETVIVTLSSSVNAILGTNTVHSYTINDDDPAPTIAFSSTSSSGNESVSSAALQVALSSVSGLTVTVNYAVSGTASGSGTDYTLANGVLTINAGDVNNNITIASIVNDLLDENNETIVLTLSDPVNATLGTNTVHTYTILDDDAAPTISFTTASQNSTTETGTMTITAQLSAVSGLDVTLPFTFNGAATATNGTDYSCTASPLSISAGNTSANIIITINEDDVVEANETIIVDMGSATNATPTSITTHTATITNDDYAILTIEATQQAIEGSVDGQFTISTNKQFDSPIAVNVDLFGTATEGSDFSTIGASVNFAALTSSINILVDVIDDAIFEMDETIVLGLTATNNTSVGIASAPDSVATIIITDDEVPPSVNFTAATQSSIGETGVLTITAELSEVSGLDVTVPFTVNASSTATGGGIDYSISTSPLTITAGQASADITITIAADVLDEYNETVIVNMGTPVNASQGTVATHTATITDDDAMPTVTFVSAAQSSVSESGTMTITALLSAFSGRDVVVPFSVDGASTAAGADYSISAGPMTIAAGSLSDQITISITEDDLNESDETVIVNMGTVENATPGVSVTHTATITDDDFSAIRIETALDAYEGSSDGAFWIITDTQVDSPFEITTSLLGTATSGVDYSNISSPLIFPANTDTLTVAVNQIDDLISEPWESVIMSLVGTNNASVSVASAPDSTATIVIYDNDILQLEIEAPDLSLLKTYDGNNSVAIIPGALTNLHPGDDVTVTATATYDNAMVGTGKIITVHYTISGADIAMYYSPVDEVYNNGEIEPAVLQVVADNKTKTYGQANPEFTISYNGFVNGEDINMLTSLPIATLSGDGIDVGEYSILASGGQANNYVFNYVAGKLVVTKAVLKVIAIKKTKTYGNSNPVLTYTYRGWVNGIETIDEEPGIKTEITENSSVGFYSNAIMLYGGSDNNYELHLYDGDFIINKANLYITANSESKAYGQENPTLSLVYNGFVNNDNVDSIDVLPVVSTSVNNNTAVGFYNEAIVVSGGSDNNYKMKYKSGDFEVTKALLSVHAQNQSKFYGQANPELTFNIDGFVNGESASNIDILPVATTEANTESPTGNYSIVVSGASDNNYNFEYFDGVLSVLERIIPSVTWETPAPIYYGTALSFEQLNATVDISGSFTYSPSIGATLDAGQNQLLNVEFIPDDTLVYQTISKTVFIDVLPARLTVAANNQSIVIGQQIPELTYQIDGYVNGEGYEVLSVIPKIWTTADEDSPVGVYQIIVEGAQAQNYHFDYIDATLSIVEKQIPVITWLTPAGITYGTALSENQLNATANIAGSFSYSPLVGTILNAGNAYELKTTFNPDDEVNYQSISKSVFIDVAKAELVATATDTTIKFGDPIPVFNVSYHGFVNNDSLLDIDEQPIAGTTADSNSPAGKYNIFVSGGTDNNYTFVYINGIMTIETRTSSSDMALFNAEVFPNPFTEVLNIQVNQEIQASYTITTLIGKVLINGEIDESDTQIELPVLRKGVYLLHLKHNEAVKTFRIVKL